MTHGYNFLRGDRDQPFLLPRTCATGCPTATSPGSSSTWSTSLTSSTSGLSTGRTATTGRGHPTHDPKAFLAELEPSAPRPNYRRSRRAVPPTCHKQRSRAVCSGQPRSLRGAQWAGLTALTWGGEGGRNCMACKGSLFEPSRCVQCRAASCSPIALGLIDKTVVELPGLARVEQLYESLRKRTSLLLLGPQ
jgi:hypothetical protein